MRNFRLLKADEIECRISQVNANGVSILLYKTARTDYSLLDETIGMMRWQNDYKTIDGKMYCGIGIFFAGGARLDNDGFTLQRNEWVWKWNCGVESNTEAEKGQASDAMKRAGFCWGIGTELYSAPFIWIGADKCNIINKNGKLTCFDKFIVEEIGYTNDEVINFLIITKKDEEVYTFGLAAGKNTRSTVEPQSVSETPARVERQARKTAPTSDSTGDFQPTCNDCGKPISIKVHDFSVKNYGAPYCMDCQKNHANTRS